MHSNRVAFTILAGFAGLLTLALTGCKEEDSRLFDETGVWALEKFALDGGLPFDDIDQSRKNRFMLRFKPNDREEVDQPGGLVAAANCYTDGGDQSVTGSTCQLNPSLAVWGCRCFAYTYEDSRMVWQEFAPGETPPPVTSPDAEEGAQEISIEAFGDASSTYTYATLPLDVFDSDGQIAKHVMQIRADAVWTEEDVNGDDLPDLEFCSVGCFGSPD